MIKWAYCKGGYCVSGWMHSFVLPARNIDLSVVHRVWFVDGCICS